VREWNKFLLRERSILYLISTRRVCLGEVESWRVGEWEAQGRMDLLSEGVGELESKRAQM
jgi:hypothetical protein